MWRRPATALSLALLSLAFACSKDPGTVASGHTIELEVEGMTCGGCEATVEKMLRDAPGVLEADADFESKTAIVKVRDDADPTAVAAAVAGDFVARPRKP